MQKYLYQDLYELEDKHWWHISKRKTVFSLLKRYLTEKGPTILDVGCGTGKNIEFFKTLGKTSGIDISKSALKYCKKRGISNVTLGSSADTGLRSNAFDVVTF